MPDILIEPKDCALVLVDQQAGLAFGVGSIDRQMLLNNVIALARTATIFGMPIVASTSAAARGAGEALRRDGHCVQGSRRHAPNARRRARQ